MENLINELIDIAIREDLGSGDHSSLSCIPETENGRAKLLVKQTGIIAGVEIAKLVFAKIDKDLKIEIFINDGTSIKYGDIVSQVSGKVQSILHAE